MIYQILDEKVIAKLNQAQIEEFIAINRKHISDTNSLYYRYSGKHVDSEYLDEIEKINKEYKQSINEFVNTCPALILDSEDYIIILNPNINEHQSD